MTSDISEQKLGDWLQANLSDYGTMTGLTKFPGGQSNPTYRVTTTTGDLVLRRKPFGDLLPSAHAVHREHRLIAALSRRSVRHSRSPFLPGARPD